MRADYSYAFFGNGSIKVISTWKEVPDDVVNDLFSALMKGNKHFTELATNQLSIYRKVTKNKIETGITKVPKKSKSVEIIKEDVQRFGILAEQKVPLSKAFKHPVTKIP